jgi:hypothetical protein
LRPLVNPSHVWVLMSVLTKYFAHLSPSTVNSAHGGGLWQVILRKCYGIEAPGSPQMHRGTAVEHGIAKHIFEHMPADDAVAAATAEFHRLCTFIPMEKRAKELANIEPLVRAGIEELLPYGAPTQTQTPIMHKHESLILPLKGFIDFEYENHGIIVDLKTKGYSVNEIPVKEARQVALYAVDRGGANYGARLTYLWNTAKTGPRALTLQLENVQQHYDALIKSAAAVERFLSLSDDPAELLALSMPDVDHWMMDPKQRQKIYEVLGI